MRDEVDPAALVEGLHRPSRRYARGVVEAVAARGEVTGPMVLERLRALLGEGFDVEALDEGDTGWLYLLVLAVHLRPPGTHEVLLAVARLDERVHDALFGDYVTERYDRALFVTAEGEAGGIRALLADRGASGWMRLAAADALALMVGAGQLDRAALGDELAGYLDPEAEGDDEEAGVFWGGVCNTLADLAPREQYAVICAAYAEGLVDPGDIELREVDAMIERGVDAAMDDLRARAEAARGMGVDGQLDWWSGYRAPGGDPVAAARARHKRGVRKKQARQRKQVRAQRRKARKRKR